VTEGGIQGGASKKSKERKKRVKIDAESPRSKRSGGELLPLARPKVGNSYVHGERFSDLENTYHFALFEREWFPPPTPQTPNASYVEGRVSRPQDGYRGIFSPIAERIHVDQRGQRGKRNDSSLREDREGIMTNEYLQRRRRRVERLERLVELKGRRGG